MSSFGGSMGGMGGMGGAGGALGSMGTTGQVLNGLGAAANTFNSTYSGGNSGLSSMGPQKDKSGEFTDIEALLDKYFAKQSGGIDESKVKTQGSRVDYTF